MEGGDSEYEEDEVVVLAELNGLVDDELLKKGCSYQFVGIDTEKPVLQLGKYNFLGSYEDQIGSALFLRQSVDEEGHKTWSKQCFSDKKLSMQRVFLRKKGEELPLSPEAAGTTTAMEDDLSDVPEEALEGEKGLDAQPTAISKEKPSELAEGTSVSVTAASEEASSDVDMTPAERTETKSPVEGSLSSA